VTVRRLGILLVAVLLVSAVVLGAGLAIAAPGQRHAVVVGVALAAAWQAIVFVVTLLALGHNPIAAFGVGMLSRLLLVAGTALLAVPVLEVPAAPLLFSMVTVLFLTTLIEPAVFAAGARNDKGR